MKPQPTGHKYGDYKIFIGNNVHGYRRITILKNEYYVTQKDLMTKEYIKAYKIAKKLIDSPELMRSY